jgi:hypothetical protein
VAGTAGQIRGDRIVVEDPKVHCPSAPPRDILVEMKEGEQVPTLLELYEKLKPKLGEEEARSLLEFIEASVERRAATKEDLQGVEAALRGEIQKTKADLIKWTFAFWIGNIAVLSGILFALLRTFIGS